MWYQQVCRNAGQEWVEDPSNINRTFARNRIRQALADPLYCKLNEFHLCLLLKDIACYALLLVNTEVGNAKILLLHITCRRKLIMAFFLTSWCFCCLYPAEANQQIHNLVAACRKTRSVLDKERDKVLAKAVSISKVSSRALFRF